jgi:DNA-binding NarL/FixJ family response regulator
MFVGADGFVGVQDADDALAQAILHAGRGEVTLVGVPADWSAPVAAAAPPRKKGASKLTHRELEILRASAEGETARRIGESLGLKERTVTTHLANIYKKLGVKNRGEAIAVGIRTGLLDAPNPR